MFRKIRSLLGVEKKAEQLSHRRMEINQKQRQLGSMKPNSVGNEKIIHRYQQVEVFDKMVSLGRLAAGVAHEVNNPLSVLTGSVDLLKLQLEKTSPSPELYERELHIIRSNLDRVVKIVGGLQKMSKLESVGKDDRTTLSEVVDLATTVSVERFRSAGVELKIEVSDQSANVYGQAEELAEILLLLMNNALEAAQGRSPAWVKIIADPDQPAIRVQDSGAGVPEALRGKIFDPFFTTKPIGKGVGMGLSIAASMASSRDGSVSLENSSPVTCFVLELKAM